MCVVFLAGGSLNQSAFALASLVLHATATFLSFTYTLRLLPHFLSKPISSSSLYQSCALGAAICAVHPQRVEAVAWLSAQVCV